jgi:hypothetical protein
MSDRFGADDCAAIRAEIEAAIAVYVYFAAHDVAHLYALVSPAIARWATGGVLHDAPPLPVGRGPRACAGAARCAETTT